VPALRVGENLNLREFVTWHFKRFGRLPSIVPDANESARRSSIATIEAIARDFRQVQLVRVDPIFCLEDGSVRYSLGRSFFYADNNHLSDVGTEQVRPILTRAIGAIKRAGSQN